MSSFLAELLVPFGYDYMWKAMWVSALVGAVCAFLSAYLMLKGWSLMGDALGHAVVPGVAVAYLLQLPYAAGAFVDGLLAALGMALVKQRTRLREESVLKDMAGLGERYGVGLATRISARAGAGDAIIQEARRNYAMIVMGVSARPGEELFFGNTATQVLGACRMPVLFLAT